MEANQKVYQKIIINSSILENNIDKVGGVKFINNNCGEYIDGILKSPYRSYFYLDFGLYTEPDFYGIFRMVGFPDKVSLNSNYNKLRRDEEIKNGFEYVGLYVSFNSSFIYNKKYNFFQCRRVLFELENFRVVSDLISNLSESEIVEGGSWCD